jgi:23S rRNA (adenine2503-C2)-methyltransferase
MFQLQFSIHSTDEKQRDWLMPIKKWNLKQISEYGTRFYRKGERKITLNFALADGISVDLDILIQYFDPEIFFIKCTPVNPTIRAHDNAIVSHILPGKKDYPVINAIEDFGYDVLLSIGELEENRIGSNCGQHIMNFMKEKKKIKDGYTYDLHNIASNM